MCGTPGWETKTPDSARGQVCTRCTREEKLQSEFEISAEPSLDPKRFSVGPPRCSGVNEAEPRGVVAPVPGCEGVGTRAPDEDDLQGEPATACSRWTPPPRTPWARKKGATRRGCLKSIKREDMGQLHATRARDPTDLPSAEGLARVERLESGHGYLTARFRHNMKSPASDSPPSLPFEGKAKTRARKRGKKLYSTSHVVFVPRGSLPYSYPLSFGVGPHSPLRTHGTQILRFGRCHRRVAPSPCQPGVRGRTRVSRTEVLAKRMCIFVAP